MFFKKILSFIDSFADFFGEQQQRQRSCDDAGGVGKQVEPVAMTMIGQIFLRRLGEKGKNESG